ncbi:MAG TPA: mandelate racemase/muconate lactonizing enzyme family protein [bacterium]|nr:mandelate racemase/muconate lactonizing enzyme family protein [bacterium]
MHVETVRGIPLLATLDTPQRTGVATYTKLGVTLVEIRTDTGLVGYGECVGRYAPRIWAAIVDDLLAPLVVHQDPFDTERLWAHMFRDLRSLSGHSRGMLVEAIAGVDIALWDLKGKATGLPLYALLGGAVRTRLAAYASSVMVREPDAMTADAVGLVAQGFRAMKVKIGAGVERDAAIVRNIRGAVGDHIDIMLDANGAYRAAEAIDLIRRIEDCRITWLEEPTVADDLDGYRRIRAATGMALAAGEGEFTRFGARDLLAAGVIDVIQPDVARSGGISETRKIVDLASTHHVAYAPHVGFSSIVCAAATLHLAAAATNFLTYECMYTLNPLRERLATTPVGGPAQMIDGQVPVPQAPGLGIEIDPDALAYYTAG